MIPMPPHQWVVLALGLFLAVVTVSRLPAAVRGRNVNMFTAHALITMCVLLTVNPVYYTVDQWLGGVNIANLISHLAFPLIFLFGGLQITRALVRKDLSWMVAGPPGLIFVSITLLSIVATFLAAGTMPASMGLNEYRDDPWVIAYKALSFLYCAWVGFWTAPALLRSAFSHTLPAAMSVAWAALGVAMLGVTPLPAVHALEYVIPEIVRPVADILVYGSIACAATAPAIAFVTRLGRSVRERCPVPGGPPVRATSRPAPGTRYAHSSGSGTSR